MRLRGSLCLLFVFIGTGCQRYQPRDLLPLDIINEVDRARRTVNEPADETSGPSLTNQPFTFSRAVALMEARSPALQEVRAEYQTALALAKVKTPLPNPAFEVGPRYGFGADVAATHRLQPFGSLGFTLPIGGRLKRQDEVNKLRAALSFVEAATKQRELYLDLRKQYARLVSGRAKLAGRQLATDSAEKTAALGKRSVEAGQATTIDRTLLELDLARSKADLISAETDIVESEGSLSGIIGVNADQFRDLPAQAMPALPENAPALPELRETLISNHPELARIRARYEVAERELHLEIAKQYPDFRIGPSFERDVGEVKNVMGLTLGIEIPVFDRNQQAIATALKRREEIRVKYSAAANTALAALERASRIYVLANQKLRLQKASILPKSNESLNLARKTLEAGATDILRLLEAERTHRSVTIESIETELSVFDAWIELERAIGYPLVQFPGEQPLPPAELENYTHLDDRRESNSAVGTKGSKE